MKTRFSQADRLIAMYKHRLQYVKVMTAARIMQAQQRPRDSGGRMPILSGELQDSLIVDAGGTLLIGREAYRELISLPSFKGNITWGWTAPYADRINWGFTGMDSMGRYYNQAGVHYIEYGEGLAKRIARDEIKRASNMK